MTDSEEGPGAPWGTRCTRLRARVGRRRLGRRRHAERPNGAHDADESAGHEPEPQERHARLGSVQVWLGWSQSTDDTDPQYAIEYEIYVNGVLSPLAVGAGIDMDFVYGTAFGENTFTVKAVDRAGNTSEASNPATAVLWPC